MTVTVSVVDYGMGNLYSVTRALEHSGARVLMCDSPSSVLDAERLVLPGVGAFADGMAELRERGLEQPLIEYGHSGRLFLGICLGMQMLFTMSEEFGEHRGLDLIPGRVLSIPAMTAAGIPHRIPHIGWNNLVMPETSADWQDTILQGLTPGDSAYFVHSYAAVPEDPAHRLADCIYGGRRIAAVVRSDRIYGCQFHPEKSGQVGLTLLRHFIAMHA